MASNDVCEHQNANYLRMMSERDALRDVVRELDAVMHHHAERADAAEAEVERLREGIFAAATVLNREFYRLPAPWVGRLAADLRALLTGSGEQPGEDVTCSRCQTCGRDQRAGWCKHPAPVAPDSGNAHEPGDDEHTPGVNVTQPAIPDSADVLREAEAALIRATKGDDPTAWAGTGWWHVHRLLDVVGQGVTAEAVRARLYTPEGQVRQEVQDEVEAAIRRYPNMDARSWLGGVAAVGAVYRAVVRPTGQEGA